MKKINWINLTENTTPTPNTLVLIKRTPNKVEENPIYIGQRTGNKFSVNPDSSRQCEWWGRSISDTEIETRGRFDTSNFSDVTVIAWAPISEIKKIC